MLQAKLLEAFRPVDFNQRARDALCRVHQTGRVAGYTSAFRKALVKCSDLSATEAFHRYVEGLKPEPKAWVRMQGASKLDAAMLLAERYDSTFCGAMLQAQPPNAAASSK